MYGTLGSHVTCTPWVIMTAIGLICHACRWADEQKIMQNCSLYPATTVKELRMVNAPHFADRNFRYGAADFSVSLCGSSQVWQSKTASLLSTDIVIVLNCHHLLMTVVHFPTIRAKHRSHTSRDDSWRLSYWPKLVSNTTGTSTWLQHASTKPPFWAYDSFSPGRHKTFNAGQIWIQPSSLWADHLNFLCVTSPEFLLLPDFYYFLLFVITHFWQTGSGFVALPLGAAFSALVYAVLSDVILVVTWAAAWDSSTEANVSRNSSD